MTPLLLATWLANSALQQTGLVGRRVASLHGSLWRPQLNAGTLGGRMSMRRTVRRCVIELRACPQDWNELAPTDEPDVRHCASCQRNVFFCASDRETLEHAGRGECVARLEPDPADLPKLQIVVGRPEISEQPIPTAEQEAAATLSRRESGIHEALARLKYNCTSCSACAYPVPTFRKTCYVCGTAVRIVT
jgi:hypothetical protein